MGKKTSKAGKYKAAALFLEQARVAADRMGCSLSKLGYLLLYHDDLVVTACGTAHDLATAQDAEERASAPAFTVSQEAEDMRDLAADGEGKAMAHDFYDGLENAGRAFDPGFEVPIVKRPEYAAYVDTLARIPRRKHGRK
jgi:hypothetical protein